MKEIIKSKIVVTPLPVFIIGTYDADGNADAMNAAWATQCGYDELTMLLDASHKTTENIKLNKQFTVAMGTVDTLVLCDYLGIVSANKVPDKIAKSGATVVRSEHINAPVIEEFPMTMECEVIAIDDWKGDARITARVVNVLADPAVLDEHGKVDYGKLRPISFDSETNTYRELGNVVGKAFHDGTAIVGAVR